VNPPHLMPLVELCGEPWTSSETMTSAREIYRAIGQVPITVNRTIEMNAPGGIPDYCARYTGFYQELAASAAGPEVYKSPNVDSVVGAWLYHPYPERIASLTQRRNERLAALAAHKARQPAADS
jgi:hypothetical protein